MDGHAPEPQLAERTDGHLRGTPGIMDARPRGRSTLPDLPRIGAQAGRSRHPAGIYPCRIPAGDGAPVLRLLGVSDYGILRPHQPLRHAARSHVPDRLPAPAWHRRHPGLGAVAFSDRRTRPRLLRRYTPLRARGYAPGAAPRLE